MRKNISGGSPWEDISKWEEYGKVHGEFFGNIKPVATMVEVSSLIDKGLMVEIEVSAVID